MESEQAHYCHQAQNILHMRVIHTTLRLRDLDSHTSGLEKIGFLPSTVPTMILHVIWHYFVSNDEVSRRFGLFDVSYIICKGRLGLFGHVARLRSDAPANHILWICTKTRDSDRLSQEWRRASDRPPTTCIHQICCDMDVTATEALELAEDKPFWQTIATAGCFSWSLRVGWWWWSRFISCRASYFAYISIAWSVHLTVICHICVPCLNNLIDLDAIWEVNL